MVDLQTYLKQANQQTFIAVQIEDAQAVEHIEEIASVKGIDMIFVGRLDLSKSMSIPGNITDQSIMNIIERTSKACADNGIYAATTTVSPQEAAQLIEMGVRFIVGLSEYRILKAGIQEGLKEFSDIGF